MKDGHPYETEELDRLRTEQRRILRTAPDRFFHGHFELALPDRGVPDAYHEWLARRRGESLVADLEPVLREWTTTSDSSEWYRVFEEELPYLTEPAEAAMARDRLYKQATNERMSPPTETQAADSAKIGELLLLLQFADRMSSDGYSDPRLSETR
jgi:hypothetical protein